MLAMSVTVDVSQSPMSWLKDVAPARKPSKEVTWPTVQSEIWPSNALAPPNMPDMFETLSGRQELRSWSNAVAP